MQDNDNGQVVGIATYASQKVAFYLFLIFNTMALSTSLLLVLYLTHRFLFMWKFGLPLLEWASLMVLQVLLLRLGTLCVSAM